ncbi:MAG TPA: Uma2 family endonuclease [Pirellulales bacterium]|nr:Uma2 family endonuclease [Pirellulales bacterium]
MSTTIFHDIATGQAPGPVMFTVEQFHKMLDEGIVADGDAVELIEGVVMPKDRGAQGDPAMAHSKRHAVAVARIQRRLERGIGGAKCHVRTQLPLVLSGTSEPEPDLAVVVGPDDAYLDSHPRAADALLVIEVAESSLSYDRKTKYKMYADAGVAVYWIVNLVDDEIEIYESPQSTKRTYERASRHRLGEMLLLPIQVDGNPLSLAVDEFLPPRAERR